MIIGLTGGIASGKSLCSDWFTARAVSVIDADVIARKVVTKGSPVLPVDVSERTQLERGSQRDQQQQAAIAAIIAAQISRAERLQRANFIVDNEGDTAQTYAQLERLHQFFLALN